MKYLVSALVLAFSITFATESLAQKRSKVRGVMPVSPIYTMDDDGDKVPNVRDQCPGTPKGTVVDSFGCPPDSDGDGLYDYEDKCPNEFGPRINMGCPWKDTDGDGITDNVDKCINEKGLAIYDGCPEVDTDKDGVPDRRDNCPDVPGKIERDGCPDIIPPPKVTVTKEEEKTLNDASKVNFAVNKAVILPNSFSILNKVVDIMNKYPTASLSLEGHTDSDGDDAKNLKLSDDRAASVRAYLIKKGIDGGRMTSKGFGETQPIDESGTKEAKAANRRVKMNISTSKK